MTSKLDRRSFLAATAGVLATPYISSKARAEDAIKLRCSLDTAPSHPRNQAITDYLAKLDEASQGRIKSEIFHSGQLYPDLQVAKALLQNQVDMACPGLWTQTGIVPDCDFCQLPVFYGRPVAATEKASDGAAGKIVIDQVESKLRVHVLGPFVDLGFQNWYTTKTPLKTSADIKGLKIRSPGGAGISWRISFFGGIPNTTRGRTCRWRCRRARSMVSFQPTKAWRRRSSGKPASGIRIRIISMSASTCR